MAPTDSKKKAIDFRQQVDSFKSSRSKEEDKLSQTGVASAKVTPTIAPGLVNRAKKLAIAKAIIMDKWVYQLK